MAEYFGTRGRSVKSVVRTLAIPVGLSVSLLMPALGIFSRQSGSDAQPDDPPAASAPQLVAPSYLRTLAAWSERTHAESLADFGRSSDPFATGLAREMILAQGDPFLLALASGEPEGRLTVKERVRGIAVLGPPTPKNRAFDYELDAIRHYAGGSFGKFFANIFGEARDGRTALADAEPILLEEREENPFLKAREALAQNEAPPDAVQSSAENTPPAPAADNEPAPVEATPPGDKAEVAPSIPVVTLRPHLMLHMANGLLHMSAASAPRANTFESVEWGVQEMALLPFTEPMEFPTSIAVADFNGDHQPDVAFHVAFQGLLRFFYGASDGSYAEGLRIEVGRGPRSLAAGDFNRDGRTDVAVSAVGSGPLTLLFGNPEGTYDFKALWLDAYRDYITAADTDGSGFLQIVGMNFGSRADVLVDFEDPRGKPSDRTLQYAPALQSHISTTKGRMARVNAAAVGSSLSLNLDNQQNNLTNVANIAAGTDVFLLVGDVNSDGSMIVGIARPR